MRKKMIVSSMLFVFILSGFILAKAEMEPTGNEGGDTAQKAEQAIQPKVIFLQPNNGAVDVESNIELRIQFNRPMHPSTIQMQWQEGGFHECGPVRFAEGMNEFVIPTRLEPGSRHRIIINAPVEDGVQYGFQSVHGVQAESYEWIFTTKSDTRSGQESKVVPQKNTQESAELQTVIEKFNQTRQSLTSFVETIKTIEHSKLGPSGFTSLRSYWSTFKLQGEQQFYADVGDVFGMPFAILIEGERTKVCGFYQKIENEEKVLLCSLDELTEQNVQIADPFYSKTMDVASVIRRKNLQYGGTAEINGHECDVINSWTEEPTDIESPLPTTQWWIDSETNLILQMVRNEVSGVRKVSRFTYDKINEELPFEAFFPQLPYEIFQKIRRQAEPLEGGYEGRFIEIQDGSSGYESVQWGKYGSKGRVSIGLKR